MNRCLLALLVLVLIGGCSPDNVTVDNSLGKYFKNEKVEGCFALMNNSSGNFTIYNLERYRDSAFLPGSSFNIITSLIGLQTGIIRNDSMVVPWDGVPRRPEWDRDLSMYDAFRVSSQPYYQTVARRIGKDTMQFWLDSLAYGSRKIKSPIDTFWLDNSLKLTPDEQLGLVNRLYFNQLPFFAANQATVRRAMLIEDRPEYKLSYVTGSGMRNNGHPLSWVIGYVEENRHPYFFVLNIESATSGADLSQTQLKMLRDILSQLGFLKGKK